MTTKSCHVFEKSKLEKMKRNFVEYQHVFALDDNQKGRTNIVTHKINYWNCSADTTAFRKTSNEKTLKILSRTWKNKELLNNHAVRGHLLLSLSNRRMVQPDSVLITVN